MKIERKKAIKNTGSDFERREAFYAKNKIIDLSEEKVQDAGILLDCIDRTKAVVSNDESHGLIIASSGNGKTRRVILPTICAIAKSKESMVINDTKGELYKTTAGYLRSCGYEVVVIDFRNPGSGNRWNPLSFVEEYYRRDPDNKKISGKTDGKYRNDNRDKAGVFLQDIAEILSNNISNRDKCWERWAVSAFTAAAYMILEVVDDPGYLTFENIQNVMREYSDDIVHGHEAKNFFRSLPHTSQAKENLDGITNQPERTLQNIIGDFDAMLNPYTNQDVLKDFTSETEIDFSKLGEKPTALFLIIPDDSTALYPMVNLLIKQLYSTLIEKADGSPIGRLNNRVYFILDEFGTLVSSSGGALIDMAPKMSAARSRNIRFILVCQSLEQLSKNYLPSEAKTIFDNCKIWMYMGSRDHTLLRELQELCGYYISPYSGERRPLLSTDDLRKMPMGEVLILENNMSPYLGHLKDFSEYDFGYDFNCTQSSVSKPRKRQDRPVLSFSDILTANKNKGSIKVQGINTEFPKEKNANGKGMSDLIDSENKESTKKKKSQKVGKSIPGPIFDYEEFIKACKTYPYKELFLNENEIIKIIILEILNYSEWNNKGDIMLNATVIINKASRDNELSKILPDGVLQKAMGLIQNMSFAKLKELYEESK